MWRLIAYELDRLIALGRGGGRISGQGDVGEGGNGKSGNKDSRVITKGWTGCY